MGILKGIIDRFRAMGKSEKEISSISSRQSDRKSGYHETGKTEKTGN